MRIQHVFWEANACADGLAKRAHDLHGGIKLFSSGPAFIFAPFIADVTAIALSRMAVSISFGLRPRCVSIPVSTA